MIDEHQYVLEKCNTLLSFSIVSFNLFQLFSIVMIDLVSVELIVQVDCDMNIINLSGHHNSYFFTNFG